MFKMVNEISQDLVELGLEKYIPLFGTLKKHREVVRDVKVYKHERSYDFPYVLKVNTIEFILNLNLVDSKIVDKTNAILAKIGYHTTPDQLQVYKVRSDVGMHRDNHRDTALNHVISGGDMHLAYQEVDGQEKVHVVKDKETCIMDTLKLHSVVDVSNHIYLFNCSLFKND